MSFSLSGCNSFDQVLGVFKQAKSSLAEIMSAFEFMDLETLMVLTENLKLTNPLNDYPMYVLIETSGSNGTHDEEKLHDFLETVMGDGLVVDGTLVTESTKIKVCSFDLVFKLECNASCLG